MSENENRNSHARHLRNESMLGYLKGRVAAKLMSTVPSLMASSSLAKPVITLNRFKNFLKERSSKNSTVKKNIRSNIRYVWPTISAERNNTSNIEDTKIQEVYNNSISKISNFTNAKYIFDTQLTVEQKEALISSADYTIGSKLRGKQFALFKSLLPASLLTYNNTPIHASHAVKLMKMLVDTHYGRYHLGLLDGNTPIKRKGRMVLSIAEIVFLFAVDACIKKLNNAEIEEITTELIQAEINSQTSKIPKVGPIIKELADAITIKLKKETDNSLSIKNRREPIQYETLLFEDLPENRRDFDQVRHIAHAPLGPLFGFRPYHHGIYLGGGYILEAWPQVIPETTKVTNYVSIKHLTDFLRFARNGNAHFYMFPYKNPYPDRTLRQRALWTLGQYPKYDLMNENCESIPNWVFENNYEKPDLCVAPEIDAEAYNSPLVHKFWQELLNETPEECKERRDSYGLILQSRRGGGTRRRILAKRITRRHRRN